MDSERLVKQAFLASIALTQQLARTKPRSIVKPWAGRVSSLLSSLSLPHDLSDPQTVDIDAVVKQLQRRYVDEIIISEKSKIQQYLKIRPVVELGSYAPAAYLQAVGGWKQRQAVAQLCTGSSWLAVDVVGSQSDVVVPHEERVCRRCSGNFMDDASHMVFDYVAMGSIRWNHPSLFRNGPGSRSLDVFMVQNPAEVAAFVYECKKACLAISSLSNLG